MSVVFITSKGDFTIDLFTEKCPNSCFNFLSLCETKYYNNCLFFNIQRDFSIQCGDPTNTGSGGKSIYEQIGEGKELNRDEFHPRLKHRFGTVSLANRGKSHSSNSQFFISTSPNPISSLDQKYTVIGEISEGIETINTINRSAVQKNTYNPYQAIRIQHTLIIEHPLQDLPRFKKLRTSIERLIPEKSPPPITNFPGLISENENLEEFVESKENIPLKERVEEHIEKSRSKVLEMVGDLPTYDMAPPKNMLFVCKLNPITKDEDLEIIFMRFGKVKTCEIIKDRETGNSLCFGFVGYDEVEECENAYINMQNCIIDDRLVKVDFSQSVAQLWRKYWGGKMKKKENDERRERERTSKPKVNRKRKIGDDYENENYERDGRKRRKVDHLNKREDRKEDNDNNRRRNYNRDDSPPVKQREEERSRSSNRSRGEDRYNDRRGRGEDRREERYDNNERRYGRRRNDGYDRRRDSDYDYDRRRRDGRDDYYDSGRRRNDDKRDSYDHGRRRRR